jgi:G:T-mismatch repair DNA endonuclease (very short patch repair protein)
LRKNIVGGPSIICHRNHEKDVTRIRGNKLVQSIKGYDTNALYLWAIMQKMSTDYPVTQRKQDGLKVHKSKTYTLQCRDYLTWIAHVNKIHLRTLLNNREMQFGSRKIRVYGWDCKTRTAYQFHGCLFHGHTNCELTAGYDVNTVNNTKLSKLGRKTEKIHAYLTENMQVNGVEMWECEWTRLKKSDKLNCEFSNRNIPTNQTLLCQECEISAFNRTDSSIC